MPIPSELGIPHNPEIEDLEVRPIQSLTREDMVRIAEMTGGTFVKSTREDGSPVYDYEVGSVIYRLGEIGSFGLMLRQEKDGLHTLRVTGLGLAQLFPNSTEVTFGTDYLHIQTTDFFSELTVKPGEATFRYTDQVNHLSRIISLREI